MQAVVSFSTLAFEPADIIGKNEFDAGPLLPYSGIP